MGGFLPPAERKGSALLAVYAAISLLLLVTSDRIPATTIRGIGAFVFAPLDRVVLTVDRLAAAWRENELLHERVARLEIENQRLATAGVENQTLRRELNLPPWHGLPLRPAEILGLSGDLYPTWAMLGAGRRQGVREGDVVVTEEGVLGRVTEVYGGTSRAMLLTDPNSAVACEVESTSVLGVLRFVTLPSPRLVLTGVPLADTVRAGQMVLTSGMSRHYPRGLRVGTIVRLGKDLGGLTQDLQIAPAARLSRLRHAFLMTPPEPEHTP